MSREENTLHDNLVEIKKEYFNNYEDYCTAADSIVEDLKAFLEKYRKAYRLQIKQYPLYRLEARIKSWESIAGKIERKERYKNARRLDDLPDIIGVFIIVELTEDMEKVIKLLDKEKHHLLEMSHISSIVHTPTKHENGNLSHHYDCVYSLKARVATANYNFEIQLRCEVENLWSNIEHMSFYKNKSKSRNDKILTRLKEHSYNLLIQADDVLSILRRERMKNDLLTVNEKMYEALDGYFEGIKLRSAEGIAGYLYECWDLPFDVITVEDFERIFAGASRIKEEQIHAVLHSYMPDDMHQRLYDYLLHNMSMSDKIILKTGLFSGDPYTAIDYLLADMEEACCSGCGKWVNYNDADFFAKKVEMRGKFYCRQCAEKNLSYCCACGSVLVPGKYCKSCFAKRQHKL